MNGMEYVTRELQILQRRTGENAAQMRREIVTAGNGLTAERARADETDAALVELAGLAAENALTNEEIMAALVELAGLWTEGTVNEG